MTRVIATVQATLLRPFPLLIPTWPMQNALTNRPTPGPRVTYRCMELATIHPRLVFEEIPEYLLDPGPNQVPRGRMTCIDKELGGTPHGVIPGKAYNLLKWLLRPPRARTNDPRTPAAVC